MAIIKEKKKSKNPKLYFKSKEPGVCYYFNAKGKKLWGFRHRYYDALGNRREKFRQGLASEKIAIRELLIVKTDLINGDVKKVDHSNLTISEWMDIWYEENKRNWAITTRRDRKRIIKNRIKPLLGKYKLAELDRSTYIRMYINVLLDGFAVSTVKNYCDIFRTAVNAAVENEIIPRNRFSRILISSEDEDDEVFDNFLNPIQLKELLSYLEQNFNITQYTSILLLAYTGLRKGEAQALRWDDIDFKRNKLTVDETKDDLGVRSPKTKRSRRTIIISDILIKQLKIYRKWCLEKKLSIGEILSDEHFILINEKGTPIQTNYINDTLKKVFKATDFKQITPHGLRHTHATILLTSEERIPVAVIAKRLGNTPQMINEVYGHVIEEAEVESVESFDSAISI